MFLLLHCDKTWVFDESERSHGSIYIINKYSVQDQISTWY